MTLVGRKTRENKICASDDEQEKLVPIQPVLIDCSQSQGASLIGRTDCGSAVTRSEMRGGKEKGTAVRVSARQQADTISSFPLNL